MIRIELLNKNIISGYPMHTEIGLWSSKVATLKVLNFTHSSFGFSHCSKNTKELSSINNLLLSLLEY